jgi:hypothetical protein
VPNDDDLIEALENYTQVVELMTGVKQALLARGWSEYSAEVITVQLLFSKTYK